MTSRKPIMKYTRFLQEWIDGTNLHALPSKTLAAYENANAGIAGLLHEHCLTVLSKTIPLANRKFSESTAKNQKDTASIITLKELLGSLILWGESFEDGRLDFVLSQSEDLRESVFDLLLTFAEKLSHKLLSSVMSFAQVEEKADIDSLLLELNVLIEKAKVVEVEDQAAEQDSDVESTFSEDDETLGDDNHTIQSLKTITSCLMDLLPSIENALKHFSNHQSADQSFLSSTFQVSGPAQNYVRMISDKYEKAESRLIRRLGEANWQRHGILRARLEDEFVDPASEIPGTSVGQEDQAKSKFVPVSLFHDSGFGASHGTQSSYAITVASHSSFVSSLGDKESGGPRVPTMPHEVHQGIPFECFICGHYLSKIKNRIDWKRHVFADLKPYICTFSNCRDELLTFPTRKLWEEHEFGQHRIEKYWNCLECPEKLLSLEAWEDHLQGLHGRVLSKNQRNIFLPVVEKAKKQDIKSQACPLCLKQPNGPRRAFVAHVAKHMEEIALAALPRGSESDSDAQSNATRQTDASIDAPADPRLDLATLSAENTVAETYLSPVTEDGVTAAETGKIQRMENEESVKTFWDNEKEILKDAIDESHLSTARQGFHPEQPQESLTSPKAGSLFQDSNIKQPLFNIEKDGDPRIERFMYYDYVVTKHEAYHQLKPGYLPTDKYPPRVKSEGFTINGQKCFPCSVPYCKSKPFPRHYDLERHFRTVHNDLKNAGAEDKGEKEQHREVQPGYGQTATSLVNIVKAPYQRPKHDRVFCTMCNDIPEGFRGAHELGRHHDRHHKDKEVKKWVCIEPEVINPPHIPINPLSKCRACSKQQKQYDAYYNAAAHLRRAHFRNKKAKANDGKKRGGKGGGDWPPLSELKRWMKEVRVSLSQPIEDVYSDDEAYSDDEEKDSNEVISHPTEEEIPVFLLDSDGFDISTSWNGFEPQDPSPSRYQPQPLLSRYSPSPITPQYGSSGYLSFGGSLDPHYQAPQDPFPSEYQPQPLLSRYSPPPITPQHGSSGYLSFGGSPGPHSRRHSFLSPDISPPACPSQELGGSGGEVPQQESFLN